MPHQGDSQQLRGKFVQHLVPHSDTPLDMVDDKSGGLPHPTKLILHSRVQQAPCSSLGLCDLLFQARPQPGNSDCAHEPGNPQDNYLAQTKRQRCVLHWNPEAKALVCYINVLFFCSVCAVRGFVRTHFLPFTRSDRESRTTLHSINLWTNLHGFNPYFLQI